jgi:hypothetical protein
VSTLPDDAREGVRPAMASEGVEALAGGAALTASGRPAAAGGLAPPERVARVRGAAVGTGAGRRLGVDGRGAAAVPEVVAGTCPPAGSGATLVGDVAVPATAA